MKKYISLLFLIFSLSTSYVFGYYNYDDFIDFLVHSNQFRARLDRLGFKLETTGVHITAGFAGFGGGNIISSSTANKYATNGTDAFKFTPSPIVGVGYKMPVFGIGAGYQYTYDEKYQIHTPVITMTALDDNIRLSVPVSVGIGYKENTNWMGISTVAEARYYFNLPFMSHLRLYVKYGEYNNRTLQDAKKSSFGLAARLYFRVELDDLLIEPIIRVHYDQAIEKNNDNFEITAQNRGGFSTSIDYKNQNPNDLALIRNAYFFKIDQPYRIGVALPVGFTAGNDFITMYIEPALSFSVISGKRIYDSNFNGISEGKTRTAPFYSFSYLVYGEFYVKPIPSLEWYTELQTGGVSVGGFNRANGITEFVFNATTGLTWYFNLPNN